MEVILVALGVLAVAGIWGYTGLLLWCMGKGTHPRCRCLLG